MTMVGTDASEGVVVHSMNWNLKHESSASHPLPPPGIWMIVLSGSDRRIPRTSCGCPGKPDLSSLPGFVMK